MNVVVYLRRIRTGTFINVGYDHNLYQIADIYGSLRGKPILKFVYGNLYPLEDNGTLIASFANVDWPELRGRI